MSMMVNGVELQPDLSGGLWWADRRTLIVADLHLEKASDRAARSTLLPPDDTTETLQRLAAAMDRLQPLRVVALGDSFQDADPGARLSPEDSALLAGLIARTDWVWVTGSNDPDPTGSWGGRALSELAMEALVFRHQAETRTPPGEISGHYHPRAAIVVRARRVTGRCFVSDSERAILPAFGAFAGGVDAGDPAISKLFRGRYWAHLVGRERIVSVPQDRLVRSWF